MSVCAAFGGFKISFLTDTIQGAMVMGLVVIATITIGATVDIKPHLIEESGLLKGSLIGWQLLYILPVAIFTNDFFLAQLWLRTFASKTDKDLKIGASIATGAILCVIVLVGCTGLIAVWSAAWPGDPPQAGSVVFFSLLDSLPNWVVGIVLVMVVCLSTSAFDSIQSAMVSTASNDLFRNRLNIWVTRALVVVVIIPVIVIALQAPSILQIYLVSDLVSAATVPVLCVGLSDRFYFWRGFEFIVGSLGGIFTVYIFGAIYYNDAYKGAKLLILEQGLYTGDWGAFGAFVAAPVGGLLWGFGALALRLTYQYIMTRVKGHRFDALDRPVAPSTDDDDVPEDEEPTVQREVVKPNAAGKFF